MGTFYLRILYDITVRCHIPPNDDVLFYVPSSAITFVN